MEFAEIVRILRRRWVAALAVAALAVVTALAVRTTVSSVPTGAATVQILVDSPDSALANLSQETVPLTTRASVFAQVMTSAAVLEDIARSAGVPVTQMTAQGPYSGAGQSLDVVTPSEARGTQLAAQTVKYRLTFVAQTNEPVVTASVQGPNAAAAERVATAIFPGVQRYVANLQQQSATPQQDRVTIRQLGPPQAGAVNSSARSTLMFAAFFGVLLVGLLALVGIDVARRPRLVPAIEQPTPLPPAVELTRGEDPERPSEGVRLASERLPDFDDLPLYMRSSAPHESGSPAPVSAGPAPVERRR